MENTETQSPTLKIDNVTYQLLQRCALIEQREIEEIVNSLIRPYLEKFVFNTLEEWESVKELKELEELTNNFASGDNFDPNHIPFNTQVLGLRRKLDELEKEILSHPNDELEKIKFTILEQLNFAENEALKKEQEKRKQKIKTWKEACEKVPLNK